MGEKIFKDEISDATLRPLVEFLNKPEEAENILFSHILKTEERTDDDFINAVQQALTDIKELITNKGLPEVLRVRIETSLRPLFDETEWKLVVDGCDTQGVCLEDINTPGYKIQIPIKKITGIIISK
jgi:hypothetical protein